MMNTTGAPSNSRSSGVVCAILAAGASRRLGRPKQLLRVEGELLIRRVTAAALASRAGAVGIVLGAHADPIAAALADMPALQILKAPDWEEGMSASTRAAAAWAERLGATALLLSVGDQPALTPVHLDALIEASQGGLRLVASGYDGVCGVPAVIPSVHYPSLRKLTGDRGARDLLRASGADVTVLSWPEGAHDVDTIASRDFTGL